MSGYVIQRDDGKYAAQPGEEHSYTNRLELAQRFATRAEAERNRCPENEAVRSVEDLLQPCGVRPRFT